MKPIFGRQFQSSPGGMRPTDMAGPVIETTCFSHSICMRSSSLDPEALNEADNNLDAIRM
jgi:hypothetical protein